MMFEGVGSSEPIPPDSFRATLNDAVSVIVPNLIFEELEIQRAREITQKPPSVPSPLTD